MLELERSMTVPQGTAAPPLRVLIPVDRVTAHPRLLARVQADLPHSELVLVWIVTPSAVLTWGALLAEPVEERSRVMLAALGERMDEARRRLDPLQRAAHATGLKVRTQVVHGATAEMLVRVARAEQAGRVLIPSNGGDLYGHPPQELAMLMRRRLTCPVDTLDMRTG